MLFLQSQGVQWSPLHQPGSVRTLTFCVHLCNLWEDTRSSVGAAETAAPPERTLAVRLVQLGTAAPPEGNTGYRIQEMLLPRA